MGGAVSRVGLVPWQTLVGLMTMAEVVLPCVIWSVRVGALLFLLQASVAKRFNWEGYPESFRFSNGYRLPKFQRLPSTDFPAVAGSRLSNGYRVLLKLSLQCLGGEPEGRAAHVLIWRFGSLPPRVPSFRLPLTLLLLPVRP